MSHELRRRLSQYAQRTGGASRPRIFSIVEDLIVNKEQRIPDIAYFSTKPDPASTATNLLLHGQEFHTSYWGHLGLLNLTQNFLFPGYAGLCQYCRRQSFSRTMPIVADMAHAQQATGGIRPSFRNRNDPFNDASPRTASRRRSGQGGLHGSDGILRS